MDCGSLFTTFATIKPELPVVKTIHPLENDLVFTVILNHRRKEESKKK